MKTLINFAPLKSGGGQNVGLNFIHTLVNGEYRLQEYHFLVTKDSQIDRFLTSHKIEQVTRVSPKPFVRIIQEVYFGQLYMQKLNIDIVYTIFGIGLFPSKYPQVAGSAVSNIFFPEIKFWEGYSRRQLWLKKLTDYFRIYALKRAKAVIFENEAMKERGEQLFGLSEAVYIPPAVKTSYNKGCALALSIDINTPTGLFLCGWQNNKGIWMIPEILAEFKRQNLAFQIVLTADTGEKHQYDLFKAQLAQHNVLDRVIFSGTVDKSQLPGLYASVDYVFLLSKLESFSNNIIESWFFEKPLVVSDEIWANTICQKSAIYVDRENSKDIFEKVVLLEKDQAYRDSIVEAGRQRLKLFPSIEEKVRAELKYVDYVYSTFKNAHDEN